MKSFNILLSYKDKDIGRFQICISVPKTNKLKQADHKPNGLRQLTVYALVPQAGMPLIKTTSFS